jgi:hypothetical protein
VGDENIETLQFFPKDFSLLGTSVAEPKIYFFFASSSGSDFQKVAGSGSNLSFVGTRFHSF